MHLLDLRSWLDVTGEWYYHVMTIATAQAFAKIASIVARQLYDRQVQ
jgi:hypothetical protein